MFNIVIWDATFEQHRSWDDFGTTISRGDAQVMFDNNRKLTLFPLWISSRVLFKCGSAAQEYFHVCERWSHTFHVAASRPRAFPYLALGGGSRDRSKASPIYSDPMESAAFTLPPIDTTGPAGPISPRHVLHAWFSLPISFLILSRILFCVELLVLLWMNTCAIGDRRFHTFFYEDKRVPKVPPSVHTTFQACCHTSFHSENHAILQDNSCKLQTTHTNIRSVFHSHFSHPDFDSAGWFQAVVAVPAIWAWPVTPAKPSWGRW